MSFILHDSVRLNMLSISSYYPWGSSGSGNADFSIVLCFHGDTVKRHFFFDSEKQRDKFLSRLDAFNKIRG